MVLFKGLLRVSKSKLVLNWQWLIFNKTFFDKAFFSHILISDGQGKIV